jgi:hypothetical protein
LKRKKKKKFNSYFSQCLDLSGFDKYPCSTQIVSPSIFARQRPFQLITNKEELITKSNEEKKESFHLIFVVS